MTGNPLLNQMNNSNMMAMIQNSPFMKVANLIKSGGNPQAMLAQMMGGNSEMGQLMQMVNGKSPAQLGEEIKALANQKGLDINQMTKAIGVPEGALKSMGLI